MREGVREKGGREVGEKKGEGEAKRRGRVSTAERQKTTRRN